jgi:hypothetical protein
MVGRSRPDAVAIPTKFPREEGGAAQRGYGSVMQYCHAIAMVECLVRIVGRENNGSSESIHYVATQQAAELIRGYRIQALCRLIEQQDPGMRQECAREQQSLSHPRGESADQFVRRVFQPDRSQNLGRSPGGLRGIHAMESRE